MQGRLGNCGRRNNQTAYYKFKDAPSNQPTDRADKAAVKDKKKKSGKKATVANGDSRRESEAESEEEASEEYSPRKQPNQNNARSCRINYGPMSFRDFNEQLSNLNEEKRRVSQAATKHTEQGLQEMMTHQG